MNYLYDIVMYKNWNLLFRKKHILIISKIVPKKKQVYSYRNNSNNAAHLNSRKADAEYQLPKKNLDYFISSDIQCVNYSSKSRSQKLVCCWHLVAPSCNNNIERYISHKRTEKRSLSELEIITQLSYKRFQYTHWNKSQGLPNKSNALWSSSQWFTNQKK